MTDAGVPPGSAPAWQKGTQLAGSTRGVEGATAAVALDRGAAWAGLQTSDIAKPLRVFAAEVGFDPGRGCPHTLSRTARRTADWRAERVMGTEPSSSRWLGGALRVLRQPGPQVLHLGSQRLDLCGQNVNLGVLGLDDPAQRLHRPHAVQRTHQAGRPGIIPVPRLSGRGSAHGHQVHRHPGMGSLRLRGGGMRPQRPGCRGPSAAAHPAVAAHRKGGQTSPPSPGRAGLSGRCR